MDTIERSTGEVAPSAYPKEIAIAIAKVMGADLYVQKRGKNAFHGYKYATVGDLLDKLQPLMAEAGLVIFQNELSVDFVDSGNVMVTKYQFTLAHTSGAVWPDRPIHTGMSACRNTKGGFDDKAANKCHTAARKYFLLGLFQVPTGEDFRQAAHDAEADSHGDAPPVAKPNGNAAAPPRPTRQAAPEPPPPDDLDREYRASLGHVETDEPAEPVDWFVPTPKKLAEAKVYAAALKIKADTVKTETDFSDFLAANHDGFARLATSAKPLYDEVNAYLDKIRKQAAPNSIAA